MKAVLTRTPESATVDLASIPSHQSDAMCRTLIGCVNRLFENPTIKADYERWRRERQTKNKEQ